jgi:ribosomal protein L31
MGLEYYCELVSDSNCTDCTDCGYKMATVTCAKSGCSTQIRYPVAGARHPKYCEKHRYELEERMGEDVWFYHKSKPKKSKVTRLQLDQ